MSVAPLIAAGPVVTAHAVAALVAFGLGAGQLALAKGTALHRSAGYVWVGLMVAVAVSSFFIWDLRMIGPFSPIHILSIYTLYSVAAGIHHARHGRIKAHRAHMRGLFYAALVGAGTFTLLPGRIMHAVFFG